MPAIERHERQPRALVARAVAAQQLDLDRVHRVDVRVAEPDRAPDDRAGARAGAPRSTIASTAATVRSCSAAIAAKRRSGLELRRHELEVLAGDLEARLRERHLEVVDERAEERQLAVEAAQLGRRSAPRERGAAAVPGGQQRPVLRPGEHPRDRAQRAEVVGAVGPPRRARADLEQRELVDRRERAEEVDEARASRQTSARYVASDAAPRASSSSSRSSGVGRAAGDARERAQHRPGERRLEVAVGEPGQAVLERDRLALLGQLQPARRMRRAPGRGSPRASGRRRARRCRRGRGRSSARSPASRATAASASCAR